MRLAISRAKGFVHDINLLKTLSSDANNIVILSDRSLYVLNNLASLDISFFTRYGTIFGDGTYKPVTEDDPDSDYILDTVDLIRGELSVAAIDELTRIADVLEKAYDSQYVNLDDLISVLPGGPTGKWGKWLEVMGEYSEALNYLLPSFSLQLPKTDLVKTITEAIFRKRLLEGVNDIAMQLESLNISTSGLGAKEIVDNLIALLPADELTDWFLGDLDESISSISDALITTLTGNYTTNRLDDIRNALDGGISTPPHAISGNYVTKRLADLRRSLDEVAQLQLQTNVTINQSAPHNGVVSIGGEYDQFQTQEAYFDAKCNASNAIYDTLHGFAAAMASTDLAELQTGAAGGMSAQLSYILNKSGVLGWAVTKVSSFVTGIAITLLGGETVSFSNIASAMNDEHTALVQALYNASTATAARANFLAVLATATTSLTATETAIVSDLITYDLVNQLFAPREDALSYQSSSPVSCGSGGTSWTFDTGLQSWTFRDDSDNNGVSAMSHDAVNEALQFDLDVPGGIAHTKSIGTAISPTLAIAVSVGNSVQADYSLPLENNYETWKTVKVIYTDATSEEHTNIDTIASTVTLDITQSKTIETIEVSITLYNGVTSLELHETINVLEVRVQ